MTLYEWNPSVGPDGIVNGSTTPKTGFCWPASRKGRDHCTRARARSYYARRSQRIKKTIDILVEEQWGGR